MKNFDYCKYTYLHRKAFLYCVNKLIIDEKDKVEMLERAKNHDLDKVLYYQFLPKKEASNLHRRICSHHMENDIKKTYYDYLEAIIDYECAGYTKPDKPLNAFDTINKYNPTNKEKLLSILHDMGLDYSYTVTTDLVGIEYMKKYENVSEEDILKEVFSYIARNPQVYINFDK